MTPSKGAVTKASEQVGLLDGEGGLLLVDGRLGLGDARLGGLAVLIAVLALPAGQGGLGLGRPPSGRCPPRMGRRLQLLQGGDGRCRGPAWSWATFAASGVRALSRLAWACTTACRAFSMSNGVTLRSLSRLPGLVDGGLGGGEVGGRRRGRVGDAVVVGLGVGQGLLQQAHVPVGGAGVLRLVQVVLSDAQVDLGLGDGQIELLARGRARVCGRWRRRWPCPGRPGRRSTRRWRVAMSSGRGRAVTPCPSPPSSDLGQARLGLVEGGLGGGDLFGARRAAGCAGCPAGPWPRSGRTRRRGRLRAARRPPPGPADCWPRPAGTGRRGRLPGARRAWARSRRVWAEDDGRLGGCDVLRAGHRPAPGRGGCGRRPPATAATATSSGLAPARTVERRDWAAERLAWALATLARAWATWASFVVWSSSAIRSPDLTAGPDVEGQAGHPPVDARQDGHLLLGLDRPAVVDGGGDRLPRHLGRR